MVVEVGKAQDNEAGDSQAHAETSPRAEGTDSQAHAGTSPKAEGTDSQAHAETSPQVQGSDGRAHAETSPRAEGTDSQAHAETSPRAEVSDSQADAGAFTGPKRRWWRSWKSWVALVVPLAAAAELAAHVAQTRRVAPDAAWDQARESARAMLQPSDGLIFSPRWAEPVGRMHLGDELATLERMAPPDYSRFPRVLEVSIRGEERPETRGWSVLDDRRAGPVRLRMLANPARVELLDDLVGHVRPQALAVVEASLADGTERVCPFADHGPRSGGLGFGPAIPSAKFNCSRGGPVGVTVVTDLDYYPHRCIYAPPPGSGAALRLRFASIRFGTVLRGHHGLYVEAERLKQGAPIELSFRAGERMIGTTAHEDGEGWVAFQFDTTELNGVTEELTVEVSSSFSDRRMYCFEADTRVAR